MDVLRKSISGRVGYGEGREGRVAKERRRKSSREVKSRMIDGFCSGQDNLFLRHMAMKKLRISVTRPTIPKSMMNSIKVWKI